MVVLGVAGIVCKTRIEVAVLVKVLPVVAEAESTSESRHDYSEEEEVDHSGNNKESKILVEPLRNSSLEFEKPLQDDSQNTQESEKELYTDQDDVIIRFIFKIRKRLIFFFGLRKVRSLVTKIFENFFNFCFFEQRHEAIAVYIAFAELVEIQK